MPGNRLGRAYGGPDPSGGVAEPSQYYLCVTPYDQCSLASSPGSLAAGRRAHVPPAIGARSNKRFLHAVSAAALVLIRGIACRRYSPTTRSGPICDRQFTTNTRESMTLRAVVFRTCRCFPDKPFGSSSPSQSSGSRQRSINTGEDPPKNTHSLLRPAVRSGSSHRQHPL
jgi:hypothetical protein